MPWPASVRSKRSSRRSVTTRDGPLRPRAEGPPTDRPLTAGPLPGIPMLTAPQEGPDRPDG